jgi:hypothetical protein
MAYESTWHRASVDTERFRSKRFWFWWVEVIGAGAIAGLTAGILWERSILSAWQVGLITFGVFAIGFLIIYALIFLWNLFRAPYHQRNEVRTLLAERPKPKPLTNRGDLLRTIAEVRIATIQFVESIENLKKWAKLHPNLVNVEVMTTIDKAQHRQKNAYETMEKEILVAGSDYEPILKPLYLFMQSSAILNESPTENKGTLLTYKSKLEKVITETRNKIDELNPQVSHKGDSQD